MSQLLQAPYIQQKSITLIFPTTTNYYQMTCKKVIFHFVSEFKRGEEF